jgi:ABC-type glycerol-3-phosphate transport system substrate-binding protein
MRSSTVSCLAALAALAACHKAKPAAPLVAPAPELQVQVRAVEPTAILLSDNARVFADSIRKVIRDTVEWRQIWEQATRLRSNPPARPPIDFSRDFVILAAAGQGRPGDVIHVDSMGYSRKLAVIVVRTTTGCQNIPATAYPFELARVPRFDGEVAFREQKAKAPECQ